MPVDHSGNHRINIAENKQINLFCKQFPDRTGNSE
jgi:hypothetical protein